MTSTRTFSPGRIRAWNDPRIRALNPGLTMPNRSIALVARQDGSGTTFALTNHLSAVSAAWRDRGPGVGNLVDWRGMAMLARGNEGMAARIKGSEDSIGYLEYYFAQRLGLAVAHLQNSAGRYVEPGERGGQMALTSNAGRCRTTSGCSCRTRRGGVVPDRDLQLAAALCDITPTRQGGRAEEVRTWGLTTGQTLQP